MATTFTSDKIYATQGNRYMYVYLTQTKGTAAENTSNITWELRTEGDKGNNYSTGPTKLDITYNNTTYTVYEEDRIEWNVGTFPATAGSVSGNFTYHHANTGAADSIDISLKSAIYTGAWQSTTITNSWTPDSIDRYFSSQPEIAAGNPQETTVDVVWKTSEKSSSVEFWWKKSTENVFPTNNTMTVNFTTPTAGGTTVISGLEPGTKYDIVAYPRRADTGMTTQSNWASATTFLYPYVKTTPNFTIGDSLTLKIYNPLSRSVAVSVINAAGTEYAASTTQNEEITGYNGAGYIDFWYNGLPAAQSGKYKVKLVYTIANGTNKTVTVTGGTYSIKGDENPSFSEDYFSTKDIATNVTNVTGQTAENGWLVQMLSQLQVNLKTAATPFTGTAIDRYEVTFRGTTKTITVGSSVSFGKYNGYGDQTVKIKVFDKRGKWVEKTRTVSFKSYSYPSINISASRDTGYGTTGSVHISYAASEVSSGINKIKAYWTNGLTEGTSYLVGSSSEFGTPLSGSLSTALEKLETTKSYKFTAYIIDRFGNSVTSSSTISVGMPTAFVDADRDGVGINMFPNGAGLYIKDHLFIHGKRVMQAWDMDLLNLDADTFYPVTFPAGNERLDCEIYSPSLTGAEIYNQNLISFSLIDKGWTDTPGSLVIYHYGCYDGTEITIGCIGTGNRGGTNGVWLRGGRNYKFFANKTPTLHTETTTIPDSSGEIFSPGTSYSGGTNSNVSIKFEPQATIKEGMFLTGSLTSHGTVKASSIQLGSNSLLDCVYPVGAVFLSIYDVSPAGKFGGRWEKISGYYLYAGTGGTTAGSLNTSTNNGNTGSTALKVENMPWHTHTISSSGAHTHQYKGWWSVNSISSNYHCISRKEGSDAVETPSSMRSSGEHTHTVSYTGSGTGHVHTLNSHSHTINPTRYEVYAWKRTE